MFEEDTQSLRLDAIRLRRKPIEAKTASRVVKAPTFPSPPEVQITREKFSDLKELVAPTEKRLHQTRPRVKPFWMKKKLWLWIAAAAAIAGLAFGTYKFAQFGQKIFAGKSPLSFLASFGQLFTSSDRKLAGEDKGAVNILLLGIGGEGHDGANLTDTIILASIKPGATEAEAQIALLSIPRDLVAKLPDNLGWRKINSAYAYGEFKKPGLGATWITNIMQNLSGEAIPYYGVIDFSGFKQAIDDLGGIDVNVERSFQDSAYPDYKGGYLPTIKFETGLQHMNGERALQFARSRHGTNGEGSDFARSRRQQKILVATRDKAGKLKLSSLSTISKLLNNFADHFKTNLEPWGIKRLYDLIHNVKDENIVSLSLDPTGGIICNMIDENTGAYILSYCTGKSSADLKTFIADRFTLGVLFKETPKVEFQNSTKVNGLAQKAETVVGRYNMETTTANFPDSAVYSLTTIYDLTGGKKPRTLQYLTDTLGSYVATGPYPHLDKLPEPKPDFVVVLGADSPSKIETLYQDMLKRKPAAEPFFSEPITP
ncbi:MAG: LCP family protein [Patescibacteria group bacterium]|nr:LCP family protein [Patescibacteria group bacterium]